MVVEEHVSTDLVQGLEIYWVEGDVTQYSICKNVAFPGVSLGTFQTPGGPGTDCQTHVGHNYSSAQATGSSSQALILVVSVV